MPRSKEFETPSVPLLPSGDVEQNWYPPALNIIIEKHPDFWGKENGCLAWKDERVKNEFFQNLLKVEKLLEETKELNDEQFEAHIAELEEILLANPVIKLLDDPEIQVSKAHNGTTPFRHIINALRRANTADFSSEMRKALRWIILAHDWGKMFGATGYESRLHGHQSVLLFYEFLYSHVDLPEQLKKKVIEVIENHHLFEVRVREFAKMNGYGSKEEKRTAYRSIRNKMVILDDDETAELLLRFSNADVRSVAAYASLASDQYLITALYNPRIIRSNL